MPRLFISATLPESARDRLLAVQPAAHPGTRLVGRPELHLTVHFLGDIADEHVGLIREALAKVRGTACSVALRGIGQFPLEGVPRVVWAGVEATPGLLNLHRSLADALRDAVGFQSEDRPYFPHVTLAYFNLPAPPEAITQYLEGNKTFHVPDVLLGEFALLSSVIVENVPRYETEAVFALLPNTDFV
jgi:2'-5' RNA ligase